jgi:peptidoglycan/LPS O-acetylase OafA/YrhL
MSSIKYRPDIDGLRAVAVLGVVIFHAFPDILQGGFIGVDVFFVISGYLITSIIVSDYKKRNFSFKDFWGKRIKRIFPALVTVLVFTLLFGWFLLFTEEYSQLGKHTIGGGVFIQNWILMDEIGYFDNDSERKLLLHLWSLAIEEQFYIVWPFVIVGVLKFCRTLFLPIFLLMLLSFLYGIYLVFTAPVDAFFNTLGRGWELMFGAMLAIIRVGSEDYDENKIQSNRTLSHVLSLLGVSLIIIGYCVIEKSMAFPGYLALIPVIGAVFVIFAGKEAYFNRYILSNKLMVRVGLISYPLYLWHWPLLSFLNIVDSEENISFRLLAIGFAVFLSWVTYRFVEGYFRKPAKNKFKITILVAAMIFVIFSGYYAYKFGGIPDRPFVVKMKSIDEQFGTSWEFNKNEQCLIDYPYPEHKEYLWWFCVKSDELSPKVIILGNSYANHLYPGVVNSNIIDEGAILNIGTCRFGGEDYSNSRFNNHPCKGPWQDNQKKFISELIKSNPVKLVIVSGLYREPGSAYAANVIEELRLLSGFVENVVVVMPHIEIGFDPRYCSGRIFSSVKDGCYFDRKILIKHREGYSHLEKEIKTLADNVHTYDPNELYCNFRKFQNTEKCAFFDVDNNLPLFRDTGHFSKHGSNVLAVGLEKWFEENLM